MKAKTRRRHLDRMRRYVAVLQPLLRLQGWDITVPDEPPEEDDAWAVCERSKHGWDARVFIADRLLAASPDQQRKTLVHELLHLYTHDWHVAHLDALTGLEQTSRNWARERHDHEHERCVDAIARVLAPFLPLPPA